MKTINDLIKEELKTASPSVVARRLGVDYRALLLRQQQEQSPVMREEVIPEPDDITTIGRPGMESMVIAITRAAGGGWPKKYDAIIEDARRKYDAGTHEMATGRTKGWLVLYLIPRLHRVRTRNYFSGMNANV